MLHFLEERACIILWKNMVAMLSFFPHGLLNVSVTNSSFYYSYYEYEEILSLRFNRQCLSLLSVH